MIRAAVMGLAIVALATTAACDVNEYCVGCAEDDAGGGGDGGGIDGGVDGPIDGPGPDACIPTGAEVCNAVDDDCDGDVDEDAATVGDACGVNVGECSEGVIECVDGELGCTGDPPSAEMCDDLDNDCDTMVDEGNPEGGASCGSDIGECVAGVTTCLAGGTLDCVGDMGAPGQDPELCDGKDNDCDGMFDEGIPTQGDCGFPDTGECSPGVLTCVGGGYICVGGQGPQFELCDTIDQDCDGNPTNGFDLDNDVRNCGACGTSCIGTITNATARCAMGDCVIASCNPGYFDDPDVPGDDCLYACDFQGPVESCNNVDDDCDGVVDENLTAPPICDQDGACAGTVASCTATGWDCVYAGDVSVDGMGNLQPETECDGVDNDCDNQVDESHPQVGQACVGSGDGICQDRGHRACDPADEDGPTICVIDQPGEDPEPGETCDFLDNDCDGAVDEGRATGDIHDWVAIGADVEIMQYEASRPDARVDTGGQQGGYACSRRDVMPWTGVTQPDAELACAAIGARLCTEQEWHRACSVVGGQAYPIVEPSTNSGRIFIEAENYTRRIAKTSGGTLRYWVPDYTTGYSGISALASTPNTGADISQANAPGQAPRLDFLVDFTETGNHYVWVRMYSAANAHDRVWVGINADPDTDQPQRSLTTSVNDAWVWMESSSINVPSTGPRWVSVYMREDGVRVDAIVITRNANMSTPTDTTPAGGTWSYATAPTTYAPDTCNGKDYDTDPALAGNQDAILPTRSRPQCYADWGGAGGIFDLSGNAKEWTQERFPGANPARGGASNNLDVGISCRLAFTLADDDFFFNNVGFRCCRDAP